PFPSTEQRAPIEIEGHEFSGFPGFDAVNLPLLSYAGRLRWLQFRFELVFLTPFDALLRVDSADCYVWLCVVSLLSAATQALSSFVYRGNDRARFIRFVTEYFPSAAFDQNLALHDPRPDRDPAHTSAEHFYKFFRNGLAHSFCIEWGGLQHREEAGEIGPTYLFEARQGPNDETSLGVVPRELVQDFLAGVQKAFNSIEGFGEDTSERAAFNNTFERVFTRMKRRRPLP